MRVLFAVSAWSGHYYAMVPLAWALRAAGHEVRVLCDLSEVDRVAGAGLTPVPVLDSLDVTLHARALNVLGDHFGDWPYPDPPPRPDVPETVDEPLDRSASDVLGWWDETTRSAGKRLRHSIDAAVGYTLRWHPDLVVHDVVCYEGPLAAEAAGVPNVLQLWGPTGAEGSFGVVRGNGGSEHFSSAIAKRALVEMVGRDLAELILGRARYVLDPCPDEVREDIATHRLPIRYLPYNGSGPEPTDLPERTGRTRVCVVWGRSGTRCFGERTNKLPEVVRAAGEFDNEVLLLAPRLDVEACGVLPDSVRPMVEVPLHLVLANCDAVVHYGSGGATMTAVGAGVPQLALPFTRSGVLLSERFTAAGCALTVPNYEADVDTVRAALARLLDEPSFASTARELAGSAAAMPTPAAVVGSLERIADRSGLLAAG